MDGVDIICIDSEGDSEEHALVISDTEEDVIFITKIDPDQTKKSVNKERTSASNGLQQLSEPLDLTVSEQKDNKVVPTSGICTLGERQNGSLSSSDCFVLGEAPDGDMSLDLSVTSLNRPPSAVISSSERWIVESGKAKSRNTFKRRIRSSGSLESSDDSSVLSDANGNSDWDSDGSSGTLSSGESAIHQNHLSSRFCSSPTSSNPVTDLSPDSDLSQTSKSTSTNSLPIVPPTPIFDKLIQFPLLEKCSSESISRSSDLPNAGSKGDSGAPNGIETSEKRAKAGHNSAISHKRCRLDTDLATDCILNSDFFDDGELQPFSSVSDVLFAVKPHSECKLCEKLVDRKLIISCPCGRQCCTQCIEKQITNLLATGQKGLPKCGSLECEYTLDIDKLSDFVPPMVMAILRKKLEREAIGDIMKWLQPQREVSDKEELENLLYLPSHWDIMLDNQDYKLVSLSPESTEYNEVHKMFHSTMLTPRAEIKSIKRVQNPNLWRFYVMKRHVMKKEAGLQQAEPLERHLFHGTKAKNLHSICRDNFDWRLSGVHGTMFGIGSYFARDACYSHRYTDQPVLVDCVPTFSITFSPLPPQPMFLSHGTLTQMLHHHGVPPANSISSPALLSKADPMLSQDPSKPAGRRLHDHVMFLAKVLTGHYTLGKPDYRKPPPVGPSDELFYDSCVNSMIEPTIFVVFEKSQCYPEYIIAYTNEYY